MAGIKKSTEAFRVDPAATAAFSALRSALPNLRPLDEDARALKAVVIGGGTGAPVSIRTLLSLGVQTSAVVAMADDGGSTGVLREEADVTPPGDIRKCLVAFAKDPADPLVRALKYRFAVARDHALGNLLLAALEDATGSFPEAIAICEKLVDAQGHVYPSTLDHVVLSAQTQDGRILDGQAVACHSKTALAQVWLSAEDGRPPRPLRAGASGHPRGRPHRAGPGVAVHLHHPEPAHPRRASRPSAPLGAACYSCAPWPTCKGRRGADGRARVFKGVTAHGMEGLIDYMLVHSKVPLRAESPATGSFAAISGAELGTLPRAT